ncbi:MAG: viral beta C/D like family protein [Prevotella sp.]|nr:viral beta C/D like family protein [Prevotella sp.]MDY4217273.1 viral beta C/D like family protein [Prevotella sp.]
MKYQITCDHCGSQFLVEAKGGQIIECSCPHCFRLMQMQMPFVAKNEHYRTTESGEYGAPPQSPIRRKQQRSGMGWVIVLFFLVLMAAGVGAYLYLKSETPSPIEPTHSGLDTIPYTIEQEEVPIEAPQIDTQMIAPLPTEEVPNTEDYNTDMHDSVAVDGAMENP